MSSVPIDPAVYSPAVSETILVCKSIFAKTIEFLVTEQPLDPTLAQQRRDAIDHLISAVAVLTEVTMSENLSSACKTVNDCAVLETLLEHNLTDRAVLQRLLEV